MGKSKPAKSRGGRIGATDGLPMPRGIVLKHVLSGHSDAVASVAFSPRGMTLVSGGRDDMVKVWDVTSGKLLRSLDKHRNIVFSVAFDWQGTTIASGSVDNSVKLWDAASGELIRSLEGHNKYSVYSVAFDPQGGMLASGSADRTVKIWDVASGQLLQSLDGHRDAVCSVAFHRDGVKLASGSDDGNVKLWNVNNGRLIRSLDGGDGWIRVAFDSNGVLLAGCVDETVKLWEVASGRLLRTLEGHTGVVDAISFSSDGSLLASKSADQTIRLWSCATWEPVAVIPVSTNSSWASPLAFHFDEQSRRMLLATASSRPQSQVCREIHLYDLDLSVLLGGDWAKDAVCYRNAKVVLVGDSGVGKSGLALRMTTGKFEATESTHGRHVWLFDAREVPLNDGRQQKRETLLWDLAGQPGYRLVHQLNIDAAAVALVLIDSRSETDPLGPAEFWAKAIDQARSEVPISKILVEARADRGGVAVSQEQIDLFCERFGFDGFFRTSAKTGSGVDQLSQAVREAIAWDKLPEVVSTMLFSRIRKFLSAEKERGDQVLVEELTKFQERYIQNTADKVSAAEFRTVVSRLTASGLAQFLVFTVLDGERETDYVLMQPEYLDSYSSAIINQARQDPRGIGHVSEAQIRRAELGLADSDRIRDRKTEKLVIAEAIEQLLAHDIALRERLPEDHSEAGDFLVLPSQYTRNSPYPGKKLAGVAYEFEGATRAVFATLVVRLAHHRHYVESEFWRDAARYSTQDFGQFIVVLEESAPGHGRLSVFFDNDPPRSEQLSFLRYVESHLNDKAIAGSVKAHRENRCPACSHPWDETVVENRLRLGKVDIICPNCEARSPLMELLLNNTEKHDAQIVNDTQLINADADTARKRQMAVSAIRGKEQFGHYDVFLSYNSLDREQVLRVGEMLKAIGIRPWLDVWDLIPGRPWQDQLDQAIENVGSAAVCVGPAGTGPWQDHEIAAIIRKFVKRKSPVMPVLLPGLTVEPQLPTFLDSFPWVDLGKLRDDNPRPLANLVAGILGRRPEEMRGKDLAEQVVAILSHASPRASAALPSPPQVVLPVELAMMSQDELDMVVQQAVQLLGITSRSVRKVRTEKGSVKVILELDDMIAVSQLLSMAEKADPALLAFFERCHISAERFQTENRDARPRIAKLVAISKSRQPDELDRQIAKLPSSQLRDFVAGAKIVTLAIVFTDIVDSTRLCSELGDSMWDGYRQLHFAHIQQLIAKSSGCFIKNTGDGVLAAFHNADDAVTFAKDLWGNTGHAVVRIRAGAHIGQVTVDELDAFGRNVNLAARAMSFLKRDGVIITDSVKNDLDSRRTAVMLELVWKEYSGVELKGIPELQKLWELADR